MEHSESLDLVLKRTNLNKIEITKIKLFHQKFYSVFAKKSQRDLQAHPILKAEIERHASNLRFESTRTVHINLNPHEAAHYIRDGSLYFDGKPLLSVAEDQRKHESFAKKMRALKFDPKSDDVNYFLSKFKELVQDVEPVIARTYLVGKLPFEDLSKHFAQFKHIDLDSYYLEVAKFYQGRFERLRNSLHGLKLEQATSVESFVEKKFELFDVYLTGVSMENRIKTILQEFPSAIADEFGFDSRDRSKVPKCYRTEKASFLNYLYFICQNHHESLEGKPIRKSDAMRLQFTNRSNDLDNEQIHSSTANDSHMVQMEFEAGAIADVSAIEDGSVPTFPSRPNLDLLYELSNEL